MITEWLYYRIYPGHGNNMDRLLTTIVRPAVQSAVQIPGLQRWFFLRYLDGRGVHVRLRFCGTADVLLDIQRELDPWLDRALPALAQDQPAPLRRLLALQVPEVPAGTVGYDFDLYEPEHDRYGGPLGVNLAERVFQASSQLVLDGLDTVAAGMANRAAFAMFLMMSALEVLGRDTDWDRFWDDYSWFWVGGQTQSGALRLRENLDSAAKRRRHLVSEQIAALRSNTDVMARSTAYIRLLGESLRVGTDLNVDPHQVCAQHIHLTNNRLGLIAYEEAYLALLLRHGWGRPGDSDGMWADNGHVDAG